MMICLKARNLTPLRTANADVRSQPQIKANGYRHQLIRITISKRDQVLVGPEAPASQATARILMEISTTCLRVTMHRTFIMLRMTGVAVAKTKIPEGKHVTDETRLDPIASMTRNREQVTMNTKAEQVPVDMRNEATTFVATDMRTRRGRWSLATLLPSPASTGGIYVIMSSYALHVCCRYIPLIC